MRLVAKAPLCWLMQGAAALAAAAPLQTPRAVTCHVMHRGLITHSFVAAACKVCCCSLRTSSAFIIVVPVSPGVAVMILLPAHVPLV